MRVVVGESSLLVRAGIIALLRDREHEVVGETGRADRVARLAAGLRPDVAIVDAGLPPSFTEEGLHAALTMRSQQRALGVVVLTRTVASVLPPGRLAELGVLLPQRLDDAEALDAALRQVAGGGLAIEPAAVGVPVTEASPALEVLTPRELDVLDLMARGLSNRGIAEKLSLTTNTVGTHVQHVFDKLGVPDSHAENRRVLAVLAYLNA